MTSIVVDQGTTIYASSHASKGQSATAMDKFMKPPDDPGGGENHDSLRQSLKDIISRESLLEVQKMKREIESLSKFERLLLYLDLPSSISGMTDPLRQPLNPLGSRHEIQLTITWIKTHLEEDPLVSLPKHEVYDDYLEYCNHNGLKQLSTADFGKVMKQVFPQVRPRRLGTRGNSRYCYAGLKKRLKLEEPSTPDFAGDKTIKIRGEIEEELNASVSMLIREWVEKLLGHKFSSLPELAVHLIEKMYVDNRSTAAFTVMSSMKSKKDGSSTSNLVNGGPLEVPDYKRKILLPSNPELEDGGEKRGNLKRSKLATAQDCNMVRDLQEYDQHFDDPQDRFNQHHQNVTTSGNSQIGKIGTPDLPPPAPPPATALKETDTNMDEELGNYFKGGQPGENDENQTLKISQLRQLLEKNLQSPTALTLLAPNSAFKPAIKPEPQCGGEWGTYMSNSGASEAAAVSDTLNSNQEEGGEIVGNSSVNSLSSRRRVSFNPLIVQDMGISDNVGNSSSISATHANTVINSTNSNVVGGGSGTISNQSVPGPSPGARKRHFSFQPISPMQASLPHSPSASPFISPRSTPVPTMRSRHSSGSALPLHLLPQSGNMIVGPSGAKLQNFNSSSSSDISRAATFGSTSECSTPFISPHGTPIPFNRSRHNSAQGRLCRSRHSSGVALPLAPYRYNMPFSPMALNNLNNPYSPQPATPVGTSEEVYVTTYVSDGQGLSANNGIQNIVLNQTEDPRSRHSSAGSCDMAARSAPMSPHCGSVSSGVKDVMIDPNALNQDLDYEQPQFKRHRHASAGNATNYRPSDWLGTTNQEPRPITLLQQDQTMIRSQTVPLDQNPTSATGPNDALQTFPMSDGVNSSFPNQGEMEFLNATAGQESISPSSVELPGTSQPGPTPTGERTTKDGTQDDLDMTLNALKDCDNDFSKLLQEVESEK